MSKGFFDHINHDWMIKFIEYNIKDPNIIGLIKKYLKAGIMDKGKYMATEEGSAQGNIISPVLANIYMHFVLVLWYKEIIEKRAEGENFLVVYADDFIAGFQYQREAEAYYEALKNRMSKFGLELEMSWHFIFLKEIYYWKIINKILKKCSIFFIYMIIFP